LLKIRVFQFKVAQQHDIGSTSVQNSKKGEIPSKIHLVQELCEDFDCCLEFCEKMMLNIDRNSLFVVNIVFSTFELTGNVNRHNCRFWSDENPNWMYKTHTQNLEKVNV